uniref:LAGLIDADG endonuclease n=1 Tax=Ophiocordycipitaceae sp. TaxID=1907519 RepID=A0A6M8PB07_9HYPO|nr:LAGLIDADG endonuclease [Ophiocordycipitaceae sp.]QKG63783.1 LAGLIDADG endonuclease [Ophiocordycipitaceae sp.]
MKKVYKIFGLLGLSDVLKESFPNTAPVIRPLVNNQKNPDPQWVAGFVSGEGFLKNRNTEGAGVQILFPLSQHGIPAGGGD